MTSKIAQLCAFLIKSKFKQTSQQPTKQTLKYTTKTMAQHWLSCFQIIHPTKLLNYETQKVTQSESRE